jgi:hypothetical protein
VTFNYIAPQDLHSVWGFVKCGLVSIKQKTGEQWLTEDVYASLKSGTSQLFMFDDGFTVLQSLRNEWTNEPYLHIWAMWHGKHEDISEDIHANLRQIAHNIGAKSITFTSPRRWERRSGAKVKSITYELGV